MQVLFQFPRLQNLCVDATEVTENGIKQLASHESLRNLFVTDKLSTETFAEEVRTISPRLLLVPSQYAINYGGYFTTRD